MRFIPGITSCLLFLLFVQGNFYAQTTSGNLKFEQGKTLAIHMRIKTSVAQQVGGNAIDFSADGSALHSYKVMNATPDNTTLHHEVKKITFNFEGMGQKRSFDSDNEKDLADQFGEPIKNLLNKKFDITIDPNGKVITAKPGKATTQKTDEQLTLVLNMLKDITDVAYPPQKEEASFFKILPPTTTAIGESWTDSLQNETGRYKATYTLSGITDSTVIVDFKTNATTVSKAVIMGRETATTMNSNSTGKIILDKATGIVKEKTIAVESNGSTEAMGGTLPVTAKSIITIHVNPE